MRTVLFSLPLVACVEEPLEIDAPAPITTSSTATDPTSECTQPSGRSACGNKASIVQGLAVAAEGASETRGDLVIAMLHRRMGEPEVGGHAHWMWTLPDVDLSEPVPFTVDMCDGNSVMWSEENCEYNLVVLLDVDGDNGLTGLAGSIPGVGEPAAMRTFDLSCSAEGPACLGTIALDCESGADCVSDTDPGDCACAEQACDSEAAICAL